MKISQLVNAIEKGKPIVYLPNGRPFIPGLEGAFTIIHNGKEAFFRDGRAMGYTQYDIDKLKLKRIKNDYV